jgi:flagellar assembly protein FliH
VADARTIRTPHFLEDRRPATPPTPASFARLPGAHAAGLRVVPPPTPRPPPTPPGPPPHASSEQIPPHLPPPHPSSNETPPPVPPALSPSPAESSSVGAAESGPPPDTPGPPPTVLAGMLGPAPSVPGPSAAERSRRLDAAVERLRLESARLADLARADALEIGFLVARRILEQELSSSPEALFSLVRSAVRRLGDARRLVIKLHPADAERIGSAEGRQRLGLSLMQVEVAPDPTLAPGDCVVESEQATVDGRLATRLDELKRAAETVLDEEDE